MSINEQLKHLAKPLDWFKLDPRNARVHGKPSILAIKASFHQFGQQKPVIALKDGTLVAGHGALASAKELGWTELAVVIFTDKARAKAYAIADNQSALTSSWDAEILTDTLTDLRGEGFDLNQLGFSDEEIARLFGDSGDEKKRKGKEGDVDLEGKLEHECPRCGFEF